jgi:hypothetical protein
LGPTMQPVMKADVRSASGNVQGGFISITLGGSR